MACDRILSISNRIYRSVTLLEQSYTNLEIMYESWYMLMETSAMLFSLDILENLSILFSCEMLYDSI